LLSDFVPVLPLKHFKCKFEKLNPSFYDMLSIHNKEINVESFTKKILVENYLIDSDDYRVINTLVYQGRVKGFFVFLDYWNLNNIYAHQNAIKNPLQIPN
jgi:hypothetical protein